MQDMVVNFASNNMIYNDRYAIKFNYGSIKQLDIPIDKSTFRIDKQYHCFTKSSCLEHQFEKGPDKLLTSDENCSRI